MARSLLVSHIMRKSMALGVVLLAVMFVSQAFGPRQRSSFQAHMRVRSAQSGYLKTVEADLYYSLDGRLVSFYEIPVSYVVIGNSKGEVQVYNPGKHTVYQDRNPVFSTENSQVYFFLQNRKYDLGLTAMGFTNVNTTFEDGLMVTEWAPPAEAAGQLLRIKMVHEGPNPIYLEYQSPEEQVIKKIYFYNYRPVGNQEFPQAMTQIDYFEDRDSLLTKTEFTDFRLDNDVDQERLNFEVPADAQLISKE